MLGRALHELVSKDHVHYIEKPEPDTFKKGEIIMVLVEINSIWEHRTFVEFVRDERLNVNLAKCSGKPVPYKSYRKLNATERGE